MSNFEPSRPFDSRRGSAPEPGGDFRNDTAGASRSWAIGDVYELLSDGRRRRLLSILRSVEGTVSVSQLVDALEAREEGSRRTIQISLLHDHLPRLAAKNLIAFDRSRRRVRPTADFRAIEDYLETILEAGESATGRDN